MKNVSEFERKRGTCVLLETEAVEMSFKRKWVSQQSFISIFYHFFIIFYYNYLLLSTYRLTI